MPRKDKGEKLDLGAHTTPVAKRDKRRKQSSSGSRKVRQIQDPEGGQGESQGPEDRGEALWGEALKESYAGFQRFPMETEAQWRGRREMIESFLSGFGWGLGFFAGWAVVLASLVGGAYYLDSQKGK